MRAAFATRSAAARRLWILRNRPTFRDNGPARRRRLLVDVSVILRHDAGTGIQRVVRSVWSQLARRQCPSFDVVPVYATATRGYCYAPSDFLSQRPEKPGVPVGVRPGDKFLGLDLSAQFLPRYAQQLAAWREAGATIHIVVYDLLPLSRPDWFKPVTRQAFARWFATLIRHADQALCISDSVADEIGRKTIGTAAHGKLAIGRLRLSGDISASIPSIGQSAAVRKLLDRLQSRPSVLMIGTVEPRKAYDRALDAFEHLWSTSREITSDLIIIGKRGWKTERLQQRIANHPEAGRRLHWLTDVSDQALVRFYEFSRAVFLASYGEGFGLPAVEAATYRRWALVRDLPVFREQRLPNLRYFSDDSPSALSRQLASLIETANGADPAAVSPPSWSWCVDQLLQEIGLDDDRQAIRPPMLRIVS